MDTATAPVSISPAPTAAEAAAIIAAIECFARDTATAVPSRAPQPAGGWLRAARVEAVARAPAAAAADWRAWRDLVRTHPH